MENRYIKKFDAWNELAKTIESTDFAGHFYDRDIWWCYIGVNIGSELDGKNEKFERPVIVLKRINKDKLLIVPLSSKNITNPYRFSIKTGISISDALLSDIKIISSKRLIRKITAINRISYLEIILRVTFLLLNPFSQNETPQ